MSHFTPHSDRNFTVTGAGPYTGQEVTCYRRVGGPTEPDGEHVWVETESGVTFRQPVRGKGAHIAWLTGDALAAALRAPHLLAERDVRDDDCDGPGDNDCDGVDDATLLMPFIDAVPKPDGAREGRDNDCDGASDEAFPEWRFQRPTVESFGDWPDLVGMPETPLDVGDLLEHPDGVTGVVRVVEIVTVIDDVTLVHVAPAEGGASKVYHLRDVARWWRA